MLKLTREYYSLEEAAEWVAGESSSFLELHKIIDDLVSKAAHGEIPLILLASGYLKGKMLAEHWRQNPEENTPHLGNTEIERIMAPYVIITQGSMKRYEAAQVNGEDYFGAIVYSNENTSEHWVIPAVTAPPIWYKNDENWQIFNEKTIHIFSKDIEAYYAERQKLSTPKTFNPIERDTMLKLILGMAIDAYDFDRSLEATKNKATGDKNGIAAKLQTHGISINNDTIRAYLNEAKKNSHLKASNGVNQNRSF